MVLLRRAAILLCFAVLVCESARTKKGRDKKKRPGKSLDSDEEVQKLIERVEDLEMKVKEAHGSDGSCPGQNVHFFFHGDDHNHDHSHADDDTHVHVDLHINDKHGHSGGGDHWHHHQHVAVCNMHDSNADGTVQIVQGDNDGAAKFHFQFDNLGDANSDHMFHVHRFGDISGNCQKVGEHYDPYHDDMDVGDLGTLQTDDNGEITGTWKNDTHLTLFGEYSIMGRSMMVHGSDGKAMSCCAISWSPDTHDHDIDHSDDSDHSAHSHDHDHMAHSHDHGHNAHSHGHDHSHHH